MSGKGKGGGKGYYEGGGKGFDGGKGKGKGKGGGSRPRYQGVPLLRFPKLQFKKMDKDQTNHLLRPHKTNFAERVGEYLWVQVICCRGEKNAEINSLAS